MNIQLHKIDYCNNTLVFGFFTYMIEIKFISPGKLILIFLFCSKATLEILKKFTKKVIY